MIPANSIDIVAVAEDLCCATLSGKSAAWPSRHADALIPAVFATAKAHGVDMLLGYALQRHADASTWPEELQHIFKRRYYASTAENLLLSGELRKLLDAFVAAGICPLLMKGAALGFSHYPEASCRPRCDTDLLFDAEQMPAVRKLLECLGYAFPNAVSGNFVSSQQMAYRALSNRYRCTLDLHWKVNNLPLLGDAIDYPAAKARARPLAGLGENAFALCSEHALLLACLHRAGHLRETFPLYGKTVSQGDRLIWLYDIHLLLSAMTEAEIAEFIVLVRELKMRAVCRDAIERIQRYFETDIPEDLAAALSENCQKEPSSRYLSGIAHSRLANTVLDMSLVPGFSARLRFLREHLLPPADYMLRKYRTDKRYLLPFLYLRRILAGIARGLRR
ncbi:MAG: nucleotidyltransferase family protein [Gammaproteobacteria bacterium]